MEHEIVGFLGEHLEGISAFVLAVLTMLFIKLPGQRNTNFVVIVEEYRKVIEGQRTRILFLEEQEKIGADFQTEIIKKMREMELREAQTLAKPE